MSAAVIETAAAKPAEEQRSPRSIAELTTTVSASRLTTWMQCRLKFYFRYIAGIKKPSSPALHVGATVHTVLQEWNLARWRRKELSVDGLRQIFDCAWAASREGGQINWDGNEEVCKSAAWDLLGMYFKATPIQANERPEGVEVGIEADLSAQGLPTLVGVVDLIRAGGRIVDFKTSSRKPDPEMLAHTSETQVTCYGLLYREGTGSNESGIALHHLIKTKTPKLVVNEFGPVTDAQLSRLFHVIEAYVQGLQREDFIPSPGLQCGSCEFFHECRAWR